MFKVDDRVVLKESSQWQASRGNPKQGSEFACVGSIESMYNRGDEIIKWEVNWDNGVFNNGYITEDLELFTYNIVKDQFTISPLFVFHAFNRPYIKER